MPTENTPAPAALDRRSGSLILFEACLQYARNREACTIEHMKVLRAEADAAKQGRNYHAVASWVLSGKVLEYDAEIARLKERVAELKESNHTLSTFITERDSANAAREAPNK